ncbi:PREDICTED: uncharacterized protein LOC108380332 [Rhagoletis zephyria]|uniref:uncharacterized protein LOC108380332 n=1 Tax=Rhagoletis zephyria TaxID=28612 RepID=UPI00081131B0|nr:PREDICTED: uncharacterized protein LOC108380332 [Rhagoletis zephyria]
MADLKAPPCSTVGIDEATIMNESSAQTTESAVCEDAAAESNCTNQNIGTTDAIKSSFLTPFKNALLWPKTPKSSLPKRNLKRLTPTVAIAADFIKHQHHIEDEKKSN